jgi:hypothetical protein
MELSINSLKFDNNNFEYNIDNLDKYCFMKYSGTDSIKIKYNFIVGNKFNIQDIVKTDVE